MDIVNCIVCDAVKSSRISAKKECKLMKRTGGEIELNEGYTEGLARKSA